jgi:hypothetical protein
MAWSYPSSALDQSYQVQYVTYFLKLDPLHELLRTLELDLDSCVVRLQSHDLLQVGNSELGLQDLDVALCSSAMHEHNSPEVLSGC